MSDGTSALIAPGTLLADRYEVAGLIATGGMAEVYSALDQRLQRDVAVKVVRSLDPDVAKRLERESVILARLDHPNIVRIFDADRHAEMPFIVMELVDGVSLDHQLAEGPLPVDRVRVIGSALAEALSHAHDLGITHRDIKPSNVLIESSGRPRLADFGIARASDGTSLTATGVALGTAAYVAPEQLGGAPVTPAADIYSSGLVLLECLTGRKEFGGSPSEAALARLGRDPDVPVDLEPPWGALIEAMTCREPEDRPTAHEIMARLTEPSEPEPGATATVPAMDTPPSSIETAPIEVRSGATAVLPTADRQPRVGRRRSALDWVQSHPVPIAAAAALAGLMLIVALVLANTGDGDASSPTTPPPPVVDEGLVRALDRLEETLQP